MHEIIELTDALSNKIAAGEVVERPASVVKELTENAIDANSTIIEIDVEEAGLGKIRIIDNGDGIRRDDAILAFKRHATSKIKDENDLFRIRTLGFRGEALPSIASVSFLDLTTAQDGEVGTKISLEGGILKSHENAPSRKGTDIIVSNLFYNTPARLKYLKTIHTEIGHITDIINRLALAHPNISFRLRHNERVLLHTNGNGDVRQVLAAIYGINIARNMIPVQSQTLDYTIEGYIALPEITRASRNYLSTMINGRFVRNYPLVKAILDGYHTLLPIGRFPIVLLSIQMDPILVDVNVHPTKMEVRLSKEAELYDQVTSMIKQAFAKQTLIPKHVESTKQQLKRSEQSTLLFESNRQPIKKTTFNKHTDKEKLLPPEEMKKLYEPAERKIDIGFLANEPPIQVTQEEQTDGPITNEEEIKGDGERVPPLYPIGQMHGTYIFAQNDRGLYMIDQHAAQERIKYEYYREKVGQVSNELQDLLVPMTLEFTSDEYVKIAEYKHELEKIGLFLEDFGMNSFIIRAHPSWFPNGREKETIEDIIEQLLSMKKIDIKKLLEEAAIMMSCKASIKANQYLRNDEIEALLDELRQTENPFTCPHGRPVIVHMTTYEMEKMFKR